MEKHHCQVIAFTCLDWRLHPKIENFLKKKFKSFDLFMNAGSLKGFLEKKTKDYFLSQIEISQKLHHSQKVILTMHRDCGMFGGSKSFKNKEEEKNHYLKVLNQAEKTVKEKFSSLKIEKYFIELYFKNNQWFIEVKKV